MTVLFPTRAASSLALDQTRRVNVVDDDLTVPDVGLDTGSQMLATDLEPVAAPENPPRLEGRNMYMYMVAKPGAVFDEKDSSEPSESTEESNAKD